MGNALAAILTAPFRPLFRFWALAVAVAVLSVIPAGDLLSRPFHHNLVISTEASQLHRDAKRRDLLLCFCPCNGSTTTR
jgi:hypothetical protein